MMVIDDLLSTGEVIDRVGATFRQVDRWADMGILESVRVAVNAPASGVVAGSGFPRRFSVREARVAAAVARLSELGAVGVVLRHAAPFLRALSDPEWEGVLYVAGDGSVARVPVGEACWAVNLTACSVRVGL
jgi:hypothetical protein